MSTDVLEIVEAQGARARLVADYEAAPVGSPRQVAIDLGYELFGCGFRFLVSGDGKVLPLHHRRTVLSGVDRARVRRVFHEFRTLAAAGVWS